MGSRGSVIPFFLARKSDGVLPITDPAMTRFNISLQEGVEMVLWADRARRGRRDLVPKIPPTASATSPTRSRPTASRLVVGIRPGEKIHEEMITASDSLNTVDHGQVSTRSCRVGGVLSHVDAYCRRTTAPRVPPGFAYDSGSNRDFLTSTSCAR